MNTEYKVYRTTAKNFKMTDIKFSWEFDGSGNFTQIHDEMDYRMFIEKNYQSKSNQDL